YGAFKDNQLTSVTIHNTVTDIGTVAFDGNELTSIDIPNSVTSIGRYTFRDNQLTHVTIPNSVTRIGEGAFLDNQLTRVTVLATTPPTFFGVDNIDVFFTNPNQIDIFVPDGSGTAYQNHPDWTGFNIREPFVTTWAVGDNAYGDGDLTVTIPTTGSGYDFTVDWGDNSTPTTHVGSGANLASHEYPSADTYTIKIYGDFPRIYFNNSSESDKNKLLLVNDWGDIQWQSMSRAFYGCTHLEVTAEDAPNLENVTDMSYMFLDARSLTGTATDLNSWNVANVEYMAYMFHSAKSFDADISGWNVSNVTTMRSMFEFAVDFNNGGQPMNWASKTGKVTNMRSMFQGANSFNADISGWDVSKVTDMSYMFNGVSSFNQDLGSWDLGEVTDMNNIFQGSGMDCTQMSATLIGWADQGDENIPDNLTLGTMPGYGSYASTAVSTLVNDNDWTIIGTVETECGNPFTTTWAVGNEDYGDGDLTVTIPTTGSGYNYIVDWGDGNVEPGFTANAEHTYSTANEYTVKIYGDFPRIYFNDGGDKDKITAVTHWGDIEWESMERAFYGCTRLDVTATDAPDLQNVTDMYGMFDGATSLTGTSTDFNSWDVGNVERMEFMFNHASSFNADISGWNVGVVTTMYAMFQNATNFNNGGQPMNWGVKTGKVTNMSFMFNVASSFNADISGWDVSNVTTMRAMFQLATNFNNGGQPMNWGAKTGEVTDMAYMFYGASSFNADISGWDVGEVTNMHAMFNNAEAFNQEISGWDVEKVENMEFMFSGASAFDQDISGWDVSSVTTMAYMFASVTETSYNGTTGRYDFITVVPSSFNQDLSAWADNTSNVTDMYGMFYEAENFDQNIGAWDIGQVTDMNNIFQGSGMDCTQMSATLIGWADQGDGNIPDNLTLGTVPDYGSYASTAVNTLVNDNGWTITGTEIDGCGSEPFTTTWEVGNADYGDGDLTVTIPTTGSGYDFTVDWGDNSTPTTHVGSGANLASHEYPSAGIYEVSITGDFPRIYFNNGGDKDKITAVTQWGDIQWQSMHGAFYGCSNLDVTANDAPDLQNVTNMYSMFGNATSLTGTSTDFNSWDV
ncbi:MAG: BspA family leucine-rich repeat surface protein, partial [Hyphomicrobiales bacterium]